MDDTTISTNASASEEMTTTVKDSLQVDTDLTEQMSGLTTESTTFDSTLTTPQNNSSSFWTNTNSTSDSSGSSSNNNNNNQNSWKEFYENLDRENGKKGKRTPPKATRNAKFHETIETANKFLHVSESKEFQHKNFENLNNDQKAIIVFIILKEMHTVFGQSLTINAKHLIKALDQTTKEYKRMKSLVRPGGDIKYLLGSKMERSYSAFVDHEANHDRNWNGPSSTTIFKKHPKMQPYIHVMAEDSYLCTYAACSSLLFYHSFNKNDTKNDDSDIIKMNISRYIRDEVCGMEIANLMLTDTKGAHLDKVLRALLQSFGTPECQESPGNFFATDKEWLNYEILPGNFFATDQEWLNYAYLREVLDSGRPLVFNIEVFEALTNTNQLNYTGKLSDYVDLTKRGKNVSQPVSKDDSQPQPVYHSVLCVGIQPRNGPIPPMLLVQDSDHRRPYFSIGLDLLMDMGVDDLNFYTVPKKWRFNKEKDYVMDPKTKSLVCGSPMAVDKNGIPFIVKTEKPSNVDFWRYFDVVDLNEGDGAIVYMT